MNKKSLTSCPPHTKLPKEPKDPRTGAPSDKQKIQRTFAGCGVGCRGFRLSLVLVAQYPSANAAPYAVDHLSQPPCSCAASPAKAVKTSEVCGFGKVTLDDSDSAIAGTEIEARIAKDMIRWHSALLNSGDVRARAAGLFIDSKFGGDSVRATPSPQSLDSLVQLAQETHDPAVYATALAACKIRCRQCGSVVGAGRRCACCQ
jgi:hypothetical protein